MRRVLFVAFTECIEFGLRIRMGIGVGFEICNRYRGDLRERARLVEIRSS